MNPDTYIAPFLSRFLDWTQRHAKYVISASRYVEDIKKKKNDLVATKADLDEKIEDARRRLQKPRNQNQVDEWQKQVDAIIPKIDEVVEKYETGACFWAICSNHKTGHRCDYKIKEVEALLIQGSQHLDGEMVACDNSIVPIPNDYVVPGSLESNFKMALNYIKDEGPALALNSKINVIGIWGTGGVGKTTLLTNIYNSCVANKATFETVIWIVASKEQSNVPMIQQKIAEKLGLSKTDDVQSQAHIIHSCLIDQNFLLFVDDLWEGVDLQKAGVPIFYEAVSGKNSKVVFTTRSKDVCGKMEAKKIIEVKCLDPENSWLLFKEKVGEVIESHPRISQLAIDVANECKGLPLALITIGRAMSTRSDPSDWNDALQLMKISEGHETLGTDENLLSVLKISYDLLPRDELKECFRSICLWPEDYNISKQTLIECWMGLDIIKNFGSMDEAYRKGRTLIRHLLDAALLEDGDKASFVKMHDVIRDLALWIASDCGKNKNKWLVQAGFQLQEAPSIQVKWTEAQYISLMKNRIKELPSSSIPSCPHLLTLMLRENQLTCESILSSFPLFQSLTYLDLSVNKLNSFPESICYLIELQYLNLAHNQIKNIPENSRNLKKLKYLILRENPIRTAPRGVFSELGELLVLDLFFDNYNQEASWVNLEELKCLEKTLLYLGISVATEEDFNKLLNMSDLPIAALSTENMHIESFNFMSIIPNPYCLKELLIRSSDDLLEIIFERNDIHQDCQSINLKRLELCYLCKLERIIWKNIEPKKLFAELQRIHIVHCNLNDISWVIHLPSLMRLYIGFCDNMRIAINNNDNGNILTFPSLQMLHFDYIGNLEKISTRSLAFPELNKLSVRGSPLLNTLPFEIQSTTKLVEIRGSKNWWNKLEWKDDDSRSHFSQLFRQQIIDVRDIRRRRDKNRLAHMHMHGRPKLKASEAMALDLTITRAPNHHIDSLL